MIISKQTIGKFSIVVFLTLLIWVWADLSQDESLTLTEVPIRINNDASRSWWMAFRNPPDGAPSQDFYLKELVVKGPAGTIQKLKQESSLNLNLLISPDGSGGAGRHPFNILSFLRDNDNIRSQGVTVESCEPQRIDVEVVSMVSATIPVRCYDENRQLLDHALMDPEQIEALIPSDWGNDNDKRVAKVILTADQLIKARTSPVSRTPFIEILGQRIDVPNKTVKVSVPDTVNPLKPLSVTGAKLAFLVGNNIVDKYRIELDKGNLAELLAISVQATEEAKAAYEAMSCQVIIDVYKTDPDQEVEVRYNFPQDYVRKKEIKLNQDPAHARFHLVPLPPPETSESN